MAIARKRPTKPAVHIGFWTGLITDPGTRTASTAKIAFIGAFLIGSWALISYTLAGTLTDDMLLFYLLTFAGGAALSKIASVKYRQMDYDDEYDVRRR